MASEPKAVVLTDLVGSTTLAESLGEARVAEVWSRHDRAARDLLSRFSGLEIDKSDGFLLLFDDVEGAVGFAISYHAALTELGRAETLPGGLAARVGIHFGDVTLRRNDVADVARGAKAIEVEGVAKAVAARTMSIAIGGQTLLTGAAQQRFATSSEGTVHETTLQADRRVRADYLGLMACVAAARGDLDLATKTLLEARAEGEALHDFELVASADAFTAWVEVYTAKHGQGDAVALLASARKRCLGLPAWLSHFGSRVLRLADEVAAG